MRFVNNFDSLALNGATLVVFGIIMVISLVFNGGSGKTNKRMRKSSYRGIVPEKRKTCFDLPGHSRCHSTTSFS